MKILTKMMKGILRFIGMSFLLAPLTVFAGDDLMMMITPALSANRPLKNVITVAKGNGKFTDPVAAVNSITDASTINPYLVVIGPGVYTITQTLVMKPYVHISGSGEYFTIIKGAISTSSEDESSAVISGSNHSALSSLTVENTGGSNFAIALYNNTASPRVSNVTVLVYGGYTSHGVYNDHSYPVMTDVTAVTSGMSNSYGIYNNHSSPVMTGVSVNTGWGTSIGVMNNYSSPVMTNVTATASGTTTYGVYNNSSSPVMNNVTATATTYGVYNNSSSPVIRRSTINGSLFTFSGVATVSQSTITGGAGVGFGGGNNSCVACDNGRNNPLNVSCNY
jgi:hypothetical protein